MCLAYECWQECGSFFYKYHMNGMQHEWNAACTHSHGVAAYSRMSAARRGKTHNHTKDVCFWMRENTQPHQTCLTSFVKMHSRMSAAYMSVTKAFFPMPLSCMCMMCMCMNRFGQKHTYTHHIIPHIWTLPC